MALIAWRACASTALLLALMSALFGRCFFESQPVSAFHGEALAMAALATLFNAVIIFYHVANPPHPKFLLLPKRWLCIRLHLLTGIIEICSSVAGLVAYNAYGASVAPYARVAAPAGIVHALTALYQTQLVFGAKIIMRPAYYGASPRVLARAGSMR
jgi:hypothetical protein